MSFTARSLGDYELLEEIARGGMGIVYKARQKSLNRIVALKLLLFGELSSEAFIHRFRVEAQAAASLKHPNIVAVYDIGQEAGQHYFSMEFVEGQNLAQLVRDKPLSAKKAAAYVKVIAEAIHSAHEKGILHRDLKPSNVLIDLEDRARVTDFGLAKRVPISNLKSPIGNEDQSLLTSAATELTLTGQVLGTPNYLSPEQALARKEVSAATDVYALGGILYYLLTARPPFQAETLGETLQQVVNAEPVSPRRLNASVPVDLETICLKCLEKEPFRRYASASEVAEDLSRYRERKPILARPNTVVTRLHKWVVRKPAVAALVGGLLFSLLIGMAAVIWQWQRAERHAASETKERRRAETHAYAANMKLAEEALKTGNLGRAHELLDRHRPTNESGPDLRGWEWRYIWQQCQSDALYTLCRRPSIASELSLSHDGKLLAIGEYYDGGLSVWDLENQKEITRLFAGDGEVKVAFSPREPLLAYSVIKTFSPTNRQFSVRFWNGKTRQIEGEFPLPGFCRWLGFSSDGKTLVTTHVSLTQETEETALWDLAERKMRFHSAGVTLGISKGADELFAVESESAVRVIDLITGHERAVVSKRPFGKTSEAPGTFVISADGRSLLAQARDRNRPGQDIHVLDASTGIFLSNPLQGHGGYIAEFELWPDGKTLASASYDKTIRIWDLTRFQLLRTLRGHKSEVWSLALLPDNKTLISGGKDGEVCVWNTERLPRERGPLKLSTNIAAFAFTPDSRELVTVDRHGVVSRGKGPNFEHRELRLQGQSNISNNVALLSRDGRWLAAGSTNGVIQVWDLVQETLRVEFAGRHQRVVPWAFSAGADRLACVYPPEDAVFEWDLNTRRVIRSWPSPIAFGQKLGVTKWQRSGGFSPDGRFCVMASQPVLQMQDLLSGVRTNVVIHQVWDAAFSPDGTMMGVASASGFATLHDASTLREIARFDGFGTHSAAFTPDGRRFAVGGNSGLRLCDIESRQEVLTLSTDDDMFYQTAFSPDGNTLISVSYRDGVMYLWRAPSFEEIAALEQVRNAEQGR